jgi:branched-chain amino acid transport system substrate-binding protein
VIKALAEVSYKGPRGVVQMNRSRHTPMAMRLGQVRSDGSVRVIETFPSVDPGEQCPNIK